MSVMDSEQILETFEKMKKQAEEMSVKRNRIIETKQEKKVKKEKQLQESMQQLKQLNVQIKALENEEEAILNALRQELKK